MNLPMTWLKKYVDIDCDIKTFMDKMTLSGSKVESYTKMGAEIDKVIVGRILSIKQHPNADKLVIATVDVGGTETLQIVTAATNIFEGAYVPVALDGATLAAGVKIKKGKLRGELSQGMMCAIEELGYTLNDFPEAVDDGIYIFSEPQTPGADVKPILQIDDEVIEFEITSNRPDCFSILGLAREAAATFNVPFKYPEIQLKEEAEGDINDYVSVEIKNGELCPRYVARVVKNVKIGPSPLWLRHCLTASGIRPINNIVDITNYVMLEMGQPMHAFDIDTVKDGKIIVRNAADDEKFVTLDGGERVLDSSMLVISDCDKAVAIAGVMGGENSMVSGNAKAILFESANFNGTSIRHTSKKLGLRTDSSTKYEKGLDPNLAIDAIDRAVMLVELLGCGEVVKGRVDCYPNKREPWEIKYSADKINRLLGTDISNENMISFLKRIEVEADGNAARIPTFRPDLKNEADLSEEIARLYGYDKIEVTLSAGTPTVGKKNREQILEDIVKDTMISFGLCEMMNYSFEGSKVYDKLMIAPGHSLRNAVTITNPLGEDFCNMRTTTLNGVLQSMSTNYNRRNPECRLFEVGKTYLPKPDGLPEEKNMLTVGMYGDADFYALKGIIEELSRILGLGDAVSYDPESSFSFLHPGRGAWLSIDGIGLGFLGEVHPKVADNYEIGTRAYIAVIDLDVLFENAVLGRTYSPLPKYPATQRDISMLVKDDITVKEIEDVLKAQGGKILESVKLFDVYKGSQIQEGFKSVAYSITFRAGDRTLTDDEVNNVMKKMLRELTEKLAAQLRE